MKSDLLNPEIQSLRVKRSDLLTQLDKAKKDHKEKEAKAQAMSRTSMNAYYKQKEIESAIEKIDESIKSLTSVEAANTW